MNNASGAQKQKRFEIGMGDQVKHAGWQVSKPESCDHETKL